MNEAPNVHKKILDLKNALVFKVVVRLIKETFTMILIIETKSDHDFFYYRQALD